MEEKTKTSGKVQQMFEILFDPSHPKDKRETCANNLVALAKERAGMMPYTPCIPFLNICYCTVSNETIKQCVIPYLIYFFCVSEISLW